MTRSPRLRKTARAALFLFAVALAGCAEFSAVTEPATPSVSALDTFALEGRFSLRQDDRNYSGRLSWKHTATEDDLLLASPFGQGVAEIAVTPAMATLTTSDGKTYSAPDAAMLTERVLGYRLPLAQLVDWVRGRPGGAEVVERDGQGRPLRLRHEDWTVDYSYDGEDPQSAPGRLFAQRAGAFELRLRIDEWMHPSPDEDKP